MSHTSELAVQSMQLREEHSTHTPVVGFLPYKLGHTVAQTLIVLLPMEAGRATTQLLGVTHWPVV